MKVVKYALKHWAILLVILLVGFLSGFFIINLSNYNNAYYESSFLVENISVFDDSKLIDVEELNKIKDSGYSEKTNSNKYENIDVEKMIKNQDFSYAIDGNAITIQTKYRYYDEFFLSSSKTKSNRAKTYVRDLVKDIAGDLTTYEFTDSTNIVKLCNYKNPWIAGLYGLLIAFIVDCAGAIITFIYKSKKETIETEVVDQEVISLLNKSFWKSSVKPLIKVKDMTTIAMLFAMMMASKFIPIPSGFGNLGLSFTYLFFATICMIYGPVYGFVVGIFSDIIGYFISYSGGGTFNLGYTLQAAMTGFIYGICFFKTKVTFKKALIARTLVNIFMNVLYGSFLNILVLYYTPEMSSSEFWELVKSYMILLSLPKNIFYLLPQSILLYLVMRGVTPVLQRMKVIEK